MTIKIIKAISLHQPWASFIPMELKKYETRSWYTSYRGQLLICAAKKTSTNQNLTHCYFLTKYQEILTNTDNYLYWEDLPFEKATVLADLTDCIQMTQEFIDKQPQIEIDCGDWRVGRYAWRLENIRRIIRPVHVVGKQGLFDAEVELEEKYLEVVA